MIFLDAAFIAGLLVNAVKGGDLVLRPHQQRAVTEALESLTLWLDYKKPLKWVTYLTGSATLHVIGFVVMLAFFSCFSLSLLDLIEVSPENSWSSWVGAGGMLAIVAIFGASKADRRLVAFVSGSKISERGLSFGLLKFMWRFLVTALMLGIATAIVLFGVYFTLHGLFDHSRAVNEDLIRSSILLALPLLAEFISLSTAGVLVLIGVVVVGLAHVLIRFFVAICWRIIEYNKGAAAAIVLALTALLGCIEAYLKFIKPSN